MPRVELYDAINMSYRIDTFDWDRIRAWLAEWAPKLKPEPLDPEFPPLRMSLYPLFKRWADGRPGEPDWNADSRFMDCFEVPWHPDEIIEAIERRRQAIEQAKRDGRKFL